MKGIKIDKKQAEDKDSFSKGKRHNGSVWETMRRGKLGQIMEGAGQRSWSSVESDVLMVDDIS
jgi:hypothetical protein